MHVKEQNKADITSKEDFSIGVMHLISLEEHLLFSFMKTKNQQYLEIYKEIRKMRIAMMKKLITNFNAEVWCCSKHLLSSSMRFMETGAKYLMENKNNEAMKFYETAFDLYGLFWLLQGMGEENVTRKPAKKAKAKR